jgi:hypothetical protein
VPAGADPADGSNAAGFSQRLGADLLGRRLRLGRRSRPLRRRSVCPLNVRVRVCIVHGCVSRRVGRGDGGAGAAVGPEIDKANLAERRLANDVIV